MKMDGKKPGVGTDNFVKKAADKDSVNKAGSGCVLSAADRVALSQRDSGRLKKMLESIPDVRGDMVLKLKTDIEHGAYSVDAGKVAEKMIAIALRDSTYSKKSDE